jgi:hypothetical protein
MSRPLPSPDTMLAISGALEVHDRRRNRPVLEPRPASPLLLGHGEITRALRGIGHDIATALAAPGETFERELLLLQIGSRVRHLADLTEGRS